jgi:exodeoxyribonuclease VII large subunit
MHDVLVNARERWPAVDFEIREVAVQGVSAVSEVTAALKDLDTMGLDVIVIARGGGSMEDLLPFSNEALVRVASQAITPIVSAIGHEQDTPLLDFVADLRASTPTDAAKRIVPSLREEQSLINETRQRIRRAIQSNIDIHTVRLQESRNRIRQILIHAIDAEQRNMTHLRAQIRALSPAATMDRGYAIVLNISGEIVRDANQVAQGEIMSIRMAQGQLTAQRTE